MKKLTPSLAFYSRYIASAGAILANQAQAKLSDLGGNVASESGLLMGQGLFIVGCVGALIFGAALLSFISTKKNRGTPDWQWWGMGGGALAIVIPLLIAAVTSSVTGEEAELSTRYSGAGF